jgi:hypothetical protein
MSPRTDLVAAQLRRFPGVFMSHHFDSPLARQDPRLDITDVYLFRGTNGTVFVIDVNSWSPAQAPPAADGFHPDAVYEFKVDTDTDAIEDITFRVSFGHRDADGRQKVQLRRLDGAAARDRSASAAVLAEGRTEEPIHATQGVRIWAGSAADPFYIEATVLAAVKKAVVQAAPIHLDAWLSAEAVNAFAGSNVSAIVLEVPDELLGVDVIGFWGVTAMPTDDGGWRQINRCAQPLVNTIFNPDDTDDYNTSQPSVDRELYGPLVSDLVARVVAAMSTAADPADYARQVRGAIFPDVLRYQVGTPANFGFARRNGRNLTECAPEVMFGIVLNKAVSLGLDSRSATGTLREQFPYLSLPLATESH